MSGLYLELLDKKSLDPEKIFVYIFIEFKDKRQRRC